MFLRHKSYTQNRCLLQQAFLGAKPPSIVRLHSQASAFTVSTQDSAEQGLVVVLFPVIAGVCTVEAICKMSFHAGDDHSVGVQLHGTCGMRTLGGGGSCRMHPQVDAP